MTLCACTVAAFHEEEGMRGITPALVTMRLRPNLTSLVTPVTGM